MEDQEFQAKPGQSGCGGEGKAGGMLRKCPESRPGRDITGKGGWTGRSQEESWKS